MKLECLQTFVLMAHNFEMRAWPGEQGENLRNLTKREKMCRVCVKQELPQRGTICLESGSYLLNFASCKECGRREPLKITDKVDEEDDDGEEMVTYKHVCASCDHVVATHEYTFRVEGPYQEYTMTCLLCGTAADSVSILPNDPAENTNHIF